MKVSRALALLAVMASLTGCRMCLSPWDYCGPVIEPNGKPNCDFGARRGSLFAPMDGDAPVAQMAPTPADPSLEPSPEPVEGAYEPSPSDMSRNQPGRRFVR